MTEVDVDVEVEETSVFPSLVQQSKDLVRRFLELTDPSILLEDGSNETTLEVPITSWDTLYSTRKAAFDASKSNDAITPSIIVRSHPSPDKHLFSVQSVLPNVDARQFFALMANSHNRHLWDSTIEYTTVKHWLADEIKMDEILKIEDRVESERIARKLSARIELLRFGSIMFVANKRDMVLLCVDTQLPSADGRLRLLSTSTSIELSSLPPKKGYNRFQLNIGGFLVEDLGYSGSMKGIRVTQVSDLGEMVSWVPASIIKMVASTMVPKSLNVISKIAFKMRTPRALNSEGSGYSGEKAEEDVEGSLCEPVGGYWQAQRHLSPVLYAGDLLRQPPATEAEEVMNVAEVGSLMPLQSHRKSPFEAEVEADSPINSSTILSEESSLIQDDQEYNRREISQSSIIFIDMEASSGDIISEQGESLSSSSLERQSKDTEPQSQDKEQDSNVDTGNESLASIFSAEESKDCTQMLASHTNTVNRMSMAQREAQRRISVMLVDGSDSLAMAIAPGARESMKVVARIMNLSVGSLEEEEETSHNTRVMKSISAAGSPRLGSAISTSVPPSMMMMHVERHIIASGKAGSSTSSTTLCEDERVSPAAWSSSITEVPYTVAMGILNLASWIAMRPSYSLSEDTVIKGSIGVETSQSTLSALGVTRQAYLQRDAVRIARPQSHYRKDDSKLQPFPMINDENLPPIGIATGHPTVIMHCDQAKEASLHEEPLLRQGWWASYF